MNIILTCNERKQMGPLQRTYLYKKALCDRFSVQAIPDSTYACTETTPDRAPDHT